MNSTAVTSNRTIYVPGSGPQTLPVIGKDEHSGDPNSSNSHDLQTPVKAAELPVVDNSGQMRNAECAKDNGVKTAEDEDKPSVDIYINNVVCSFSVRCHLNLRKIGSLGANVEYRREYGKVNMRFRNPSATATIWSSGKITITGNDSEVHAKQTARRCARALQKMGFRVRFANYKVINVLGTCSMPFGIRIREFSELHTKNAYYEPELHPAVTYRIASPRATLKIFSTGSITVTAPSVGNVQSSIHQIFPLVEAHKTPLTEATIERRRKKGLMVSHSSDEEETDDEEDDLDSEEEMTDESD